MNKKMAREIVESLPSLYPSMIADEEEAIWTVLATNSNTENDGDCISRQAALDIFDDYNVAVENGQIEAYSRDRKRLCDLPSAQPEREWIPCSNPPKHHRNVIVRGTELFGNRTVHKVMQWDVDTWRPTDYAPSIRWEEWSEI